MNRKYWVALVFWLVGLFGVLGFHRFYCRKLPSAIVQCVFGVLAIASQVTFLGVFLGTAALLWGVVNLFMLERWMEDATA